MGIAAPDCSGRSVGGDDELAGAALGRVATLHDSDARAAAPSVAMRTTLSLFNSRQCARTPTPVARPVWAPTVNRRPPNRRARAVVRTLRTADTFCGGMAADTSGSRNARCSFGSEGPEHPDSLLGKRRARGSRRQPTNPSLTAPVRPYPARE